MEEVNVRKQAWPFRIYMVYIILVYSGVTDYVTVISLIRPGLLCVMALSYFWVVSGFMRTDIREKEVFSLILVIALSILSLAYSANRGVNISLLESEVLDLAGLTIGAILAIRSKQHLQSFMLLWIFLGLLVSLQVVLNGGVGPVRLGDENDVTISILMFLPFSYFGIRYFSGWRKILCITTLVFCFCAIIIAGSRGGFLGLVAVLFMIWVYSKKKLLLLTMAGGVLLIVITILLPEDYLNAVSSITDTKEATADSRLYSWKLGLDMYLDNPLLGVGTGQYGWNIQKYQLERGDLDLGEGGLRIRRDLTGRSSHSTYVDYISERGAAGLLLMMILFKSIHKRLVQCRSFAKSDRSLIASDEVSFFAYSASCAAMGYLVASVFVTSFYFPSFWLFTGLIVAVSRLERETSLDN